MRRLHVMAMTLGVAIVELLATATAHGYFRTK
jgi:hypothetical protein